MRGWHQASPTGFFGSWVYVATTVNNGASTTGSWNENRRILRVWIRGCRGNNNNTENVWSLWEVGPIPENYFSGNGRGEGGNIEFSNCCGSICVQRCERNPIVCWSCTVQRPNWVRRVMTTHRANSPCDIGIPTCYDHDPNAPNFGGTVG